MRTVAARCAVAVVAVGLLAACGSEDPDPLGPGPEGRRATYVAMGDSFTSAAGVPETVDVACYRSSSNYPALITEELDLRLTDVSCGGAATTALVGVQALPTGPEVPQFDALKADTDVVTLSMGANDENLFGTIFTTCLAGALDDPTGSPCRDLMNAGGRDEAFRTIRLVETRLTSALKGIRDRSPVATIVLIGYPQLVPDEGRCDALPLAEGDYPYVREIMSRLGDATESAAAAARVEYVDVLAASHGHDVCAGDDAWVNGVGTPTDLAVPMHPFGTEQEAIAEMVVDILEDASS